MKKYFFVLLFFVTTQSLFCQKYFIKHIGTKDGLPQSFVNHILVDSRGYYWTSTQSGVGCFNGKVWNNYSIKEGLPGNDITNMCEDNDGNLWIATNGNGAAKFDGKKFDVYNDKNGLNNNIIYCIFPDSKGNIWYATYGGLSKFDGKKFITYTQKDGLPTDRLFAVCEDNFGNIWIGSRDKGLIRFNGKEFKSFTRKDGLTDETIFSLYCDRKSRIWIGTASGGLCLWDGKKISPIQISLLEEEFISGVKEDNYGNIWIASDHQLVKYNHDLKSYEYLTEENGLSSNWILSLNITKEGNILIGTDNGFDVIFPNGPKLYSFLKAKNKITSVLKTSWGDLLLGTAEGIIVISNNRIYDLNNIKEISNSKVFCLFEDNTGKIWVGSDSRNYGAVKLEYKNEKYQYESSFNNINGKKITSVTSILEDKNGNIWFGIYGSGVIVAKKNEYVHYTDKNSVLGNNTVTMFKDSKNNIWISIYQEGVFKFDGEKFTHYTIENGLYDNSVFSISESKNGNITFGNYENGIAVFDGESFKAFNVESGLDFDHINALNYDNYDNLWIGSENGLMRLKIKDDKIIKYKNPIFINSIETSVNQNAIFMDSNIIYIGTNDGLYFYNNAILERKEKVDLPNIFISKVEFVFDSLIWSDHTNELNVWTGVGKNPKFNYYQNNLKFEFFVTGLFQKYSFQYLLEGYNSKWSPLIKSNEIIFSELPPGDYILKIKATDGRGNFSKIYDYPFSITPALWQRTWFKIIIAICIIGLLFLIMKWRTAVLRKQKKYLELTIEQRTKEIVQQKEIIEEKHKEITDSISYAERIQRSLMATSELLNEKLGQYFIYFNAKEKVSGDFYWATDLKNGNFCIVVADSTGHGVPGAIMSMLNISCLNETVKEGISEASSILNNSRRLIINTLKKDGSKEGGKDGMDCALLSFDFKNYKLEFALANNPLWIIRNGELVEYKSDKMPVGKHDKQDIPFTNHIIEMRKDDYIFIFTDGYADQFGGPKGKKFKYSNLQKILLENSNLEPSGLNIKLNETFNNWKGDLEQVDDVCVIGIKI